MYMNFFTWGYCLGFLHEAYCLGLHTRSGCYCPVTITWFHMFSNLKP